MSKIADKYKSDQEQRKQKIRSEPSKYKRFWKWIGYLLFFPFVWLWYNLRDWRTLVTFLCVFAVYSGSVWGFYLGALFCGWTSTEAGKWLIGIGTTVWTWWLSPVGSPFILLCISTTIGVKALFNKIKDCISKKKDLTSK